MAETATTHDRNRTSSYSAVFHQSTIGIAVLSQTGRFLEANERFCDVAGHPEHELQQVTLQDIIMQHHAHDADHAALEQLFQGTVDTFSADMRLPGSHEPVHCTTTVQQDANGTSAYICFLQHIPAINESSHSTRVHTARGKELKCAYDISRLVADPHVTVEKVIREAIMIIPAAFQFPEMIEVSIKYGDSTFQSPDHRGTGPSIRCDIMDEGNTVGALTVSLVSPSPEDNGSFFTEEQLLIDDIAHHIGMKITQQRTRTAIDDAIIDITALKHMKDELLHEKARLQQVLDIAGSFIILIHPDQTIALINRSGCDILGYKPAELIGKNWYDTCIPENIRDERKEYFDFRIKHRKSDDKHYEMPIQARDGTIRIMLWRAIIIEQETGAVDGLLTSGLDITKRKEAEEVLASYAHRLEETNSELESFSYSVSHDLRAPLRAIDGYSRMVIEDYEDKLDEDGRRQLNVIRREAQKMGELIDDLLKFSRMGRQEIRSVKIDMHELFEEVFGELTAIAPRNDIELRLETMPHAYGDRALLHEVVLNLLSNAIKFTGKTDHPVITCSGERTDSESVFRVDDNGVGFDMRYVDKLFGVFQRLHLAHEFEGTGVGLALVQRIVHKHGGRVWAESELGTGATFYVSLPHP